MITYTAQFPSAYESVAKARRAVGAFAQVCDFAPTEISDIVLSVGEACNNAVEHGHVDDGEFTLSCVFHDEVLRIEIRDSGSVYFSPGAVDLRALNLQECLGRGRGIPIMRALMDAVSYRCAESGTTAMLEKRRLARSLGEPRGERRGVDAGSRG